MTHDELYKSLGLRPACDGLTRPQITSRLNEELVRIRLTRKNAYSYWAHEVEVYDDEQKKLVRVDFMQYEPYGYHTAIHAGNVERGTFDCYEVKSCVDDFISGHGLNCLGDRTHVVMPVEVYAELQDLRKKRLYGDKSARAEAVEKAYSNLSGFDFLLYGIGRNGWARYDEVGMIYKNHSRRKATSELLLCMMRALIANSDHSSVNHEIAREVG